MEETPAFEPDHFMLFQNYPNPFNDVTEIEVNISVAGNYSLSLYDLMGEKVRDIISNEFLRKGWHSFSVNAVELDLSSGTYYYTLQQGTQLQTRKLLFIH